VGLSGHIFVVPRFPSKSGLMNKHIVKHIHFVVPRFPSKSGLIHKHIVKHIVKLPGRKTDPPSIVLLML
jgi:hypothetical protein